jgi:PhnB protein
MTVKPIPDGYTSVAPYLFVEDAKAAIEFYKRAFGATDHGMIETPDGRIAHGELKIGDTVIRLCDNLPIFEAKAPSELGGTTVEIFLFVDDVDSVVRRAAAAGASVKAEPFNQFWGDRLARLTDPFGHHWLVASRVEDLSPAEIEARGKAIFSGAAAPPDEATG